MDIEITPRPTEDERAAIEAALEARRSDDGTGEATEWWTAGLLDDSDDGEP